MKIIVQAGGLGTRLRPLTANRPKCLVPVNNRPLLFHLLERFRHCSFIIIGDYRFEVLSAYLGCFATAYDCTLLRAVGTGNVSGLAEAMTLVGEGESIMVIWSDLLVGAEFDPEALAPDNYMGILPHSRCSWRFCNGVLEDVPSDTCGVGGCFIFRDRHELEGVPQSGSLTQWLRERQVAFEPLELTGCREIGTLEALAELKEQGDPGQRCRPYNQMEFSAGHVIKRALTEEAARLIRREAQWYRSVTAYGFTAVPAISCWEPLTMERIAGTNLFQARLTAAQRRQALERVLEALEWLHERERRPAAASDLIAEYYTKTLARLDTIAAVVPGANRDTLLINGRRCRNPLHCREELRRAVERELLETHFCPIHGDCTLSNILTDEQGRIYFIDARGYFGSQELFGDVRYDWAKLYYSLAGNFDSFNTGDFSLTIGEGSADFAIRSSGWEGHVAQLLERLPPDCTTALCFIHAIIWLSLASHCWEDYDAMCLAFYHGCELLEPCL